eukprot:scaffold27952_cov204-Skeletonema_marinoi.AAC.1
MANCNVSLEAVDCQHEIRYGARVALAAVPNWASSGHLRRCSDADTTNKCLSRREIRHGARVALAAVPNWASSGHLRRCSDADTTNRFLSRVKDASILSWPT